MAYAWIITRDHLEDDDGDKGTMGPGDAPDHLCAHLAHGLAYGGTETFTFRMFDDDGILYYTGRMVTDEGKTEEACYGPLGDFGSPNAGAVSIEYNGHPEMACG